LAGLILGFLPDETLFFFDITEKFSEI
jgi:hypothetical protein